MKNDSANILYDLDEMIVAVVKTIDGELRIVGTKLQKEFIVYSREEDCIKDVDIDIIN